MKNRIMICDDDEGIREVTTLLFKEKGYEVISMPSGEDLEETAANQKPDIILMDLWMPGGGGEEATRRLKKNRATKHIPIIIVSAVNKVDQIAEKVKAEDFLAKPFDLDILEQKVEKLINRKSA